MRALINLLEEQLNESDTSLFEVGEQRERNMRYYTLQPLGNEIRGRSHYISPDVLDAVESKKAVFSETFLSNREVVKFTQAGGPFEGDAKTAYANKALRRNKVHRLLPDAWHDAFVAKRCVMLVEWFQDTRDLDLNLRGANPVQIRHLIQQAGPVVSVDDSQLQAMPSIGPGGQVYPVFSGTLKLQLDDSYPRITLVPPERYYRDPSATYPEEAMWCTVEEELPRAILIQEGYDPDQVTKLAGEYNPRGSEEDSARKQHDQSWSRNRTAHRSSEQGLVTRYKTWTWLDASDEILAEAELEAAEGISLYEIHWCRGEVLKDKQGRFKITQAEELPFFEWSEIKISHAENGICTSDVMAHTQKTQSTLKRLVIDNQQMRNASRYEAVMENLLNPRDLLDTKIGGTVWVNQSGSVSPLAAPELSPLTFNVLGMMKQDSEERSGISSLAKGMNPDAVSNQNAADMVQRLTNAGQRRVAMAARDFANSFLVPLCQYLVHLAMRHDTSVDQIEVAGRHIQVAPAQWQDENLDMEVAVALTPDESSQMAMQLISLHNMQSADEAVGPMYGPTQRHAMYDRIYELIGIKDSTPFLMSPESPEYQQAMQQRAEQAQQAQMKQDQIAQLQMRLLMSDDQRKWADTNWGRTNDVQDNQRADAELDWKQFVETEELKLERDQKRAVSVSA